jgi:homocysteine S-methyltransferase
MQLFETIQPVVYDGPMETRIEYGTELKLDAEMSIFALCDSADGREALSALYRRDIEAARAHGVPIVLNAPTYRASPAHAARMGYNAPDAIEHINRASIDLVRNVRGASGDFARHVYLTAPVGPKHAGYHPALEFTLQDAVAYHTAQAQALAGLGVDFISVAAMPGAIEAEGAAIAVARTGLPYTVGFILNADANLLDGTPPEKLIGDIDANAAYPPLFYVIGCTHASVCARLLARDSPQLRRIRGVKANGSSLSPAELLALDHAAADDASQFARDLLALGSGRGFKVYGGCCGTDTEHVESLCRLLSRSSA